jgi:hypothetical protein
MARKTYSLLVVALIATACGSSGTEPTCPTKAQSLTFTAQGSCSGGNVTGMITVSTQPGLCTLLIKGGTGVGLPTTGQFTGDATKTGYDLSKGNWELLLQEGNAADGSINVQCDESMSSAKDFELNCSIEKYPPDDSSGGGGSCLCSKCVEHLTMM